MIECKNLTKEYGPIRAVNDVSFTVEPGQVLGFLGPNGAGKSTTMRMLTGYLTPTSGTAKICGIDVLEDGVKAKARFGYLPENGPLYPEMTVLEFIKFCAELRGIGGSLMTQAIDRVMDLCHLMGVRHQTIETLSKGFRQRVGMAQAIIHNPEVLIMDEPTDGLDPNQKQTVRNLIRTMSEKKSIILSTHILEEVEAVCTRVIIIARGNVIVDETPAQLRARHPLAGAIRITASGSTSAEAMFSALHEAKIFDKLEKHNGAVIVYPKKGQAAMPELLRFVKTKNIEIADASPVAVRLDDVFRELTTRKGN
jgi:ABC-2 type transport system ATP-binding protein